MPFGAITVIHRTSPLKRKTVMGPRIPLDSGVRADVGEVSLELVDHFFGCVRIGLGAGEIQFPRHVLRQMGR